MINIRQRPLNKHFPEQVVVIGIIVLNFLYFAVLNRYHIAYLEQNQLFRFDWSYLTEFLNKPGGLAEYTGSFLIQFYIVPVAGAVIITSLAFACFVVVRSILKKLNISGILWPLITIFLLAIVQSDHIYHPGFTIGFLLALTFFYVYISLENNYLRLIAGTFGCVLLYVISGEFAFPAAFLIVIYELLFKKGHLNRAFVWLSLVLVFLIIYLLTEFVYLLPEKYTWTGTLFVGNMTTIYGLIILMAYLPGLLLINRIFFRLRAKPVTENKWNRKSVIAGGTLLLILSSVTLLVANDPEMELLLGIDHNVRKSEWDRALKLSSRSPGPNPIVIYLTNIALYKSGQMGDLMFRFHQNGPDGLWPGWLSDTSPYSGCEIFYEMGYFNEAYRWAFEIMVAKGQTPRLVKMLAITSIINGDFKMAEKYLTLLERTIFYRKWARHYIKCIEDPEILNSDDEITAKRRLLVDRDFFADAYEHEVTFDGLLENHPGNRMAFEYFMSSLLLKKDISAFIANINRLKELGFAKLPVHYEEALLLYMSGSNKDVVPGGYTISQLTQRRFSNFMNASATYNPKIQAQQSFTKLFGNTYWFYFYFK